MAETKRVELSNGNWAEVRQSTLVLDVKHQRIEQHKRGFADQTLDELATLRTKIVAWSLAESVTDELIDVLTVADVITLLQAANGTDDESPNSSSTSPSGTRRKAKSSTPEEIPPGNG